MDTPIAVRLKSLLLTNASTTNVKGCTAVDVGTRSEYLIP